MEDKFGEHVLMCHKATLNEEDIGLVYAIASAILSERQHIDVQTLNKKHVYVASISHAIISSIGNSDAITVRCDRCHKRVDKLVIDVLYAKCNKVKF